MGIEIKQRRGLLTQIGQNTGEQRVFEHIGKIARMKGVAIIHSILSKFYRLAAARAA